MCRLALTALALCLLFALPAALFAQDDLRDAVRGLLSEDPEVRTASAERVSAGGADAIPALMELVTELNAAASAERGTVTLRAPAASEINLEEGRATDPAETDDAEVLLQLYDVADLTIGDGTVESLIEKIEARVATVEAVGSRGGTLVVSATAAQHAWLQTTLSEMRAAANTFITLQVRVIAAPAGATLGIPHDTAKPGQVLLRGDDVAARVAAWLEAENVDLVTAPQLSCVDRQRASIQIGREITYLSDFDVELATEPNEVGGLIADPVIDTVFAGMSFELRPIQMPDRSGISVILDMMRADVDETIPTVSLTLPGQGAVEVEFQAPTVVSRGLRTAFALKNGEPVLASLDVDAEHSWMLELTATAIELDDSDPDPDTDSE